MFGAAGGSMLAASLLLTQEFPNYGINKVKFILLFIKKCFPFQTDEDAERCCMSVLWMIV